MVSATLESIAGVDVSANDPRVIVLTLGTAIPPTADDGTGLLRLYYIGTDEGPNGGVTDEDGNEMETFGYGPRHRGNVKDTVE
jgi:hypothetical protein